MITYIILYFVSLLIPIVLSALRRLDLKYALIIDAILLLPFTVLFGLLWLLSRTDKGRIVRMVEHYDNDKPRRERSVVRDNPRPEKKDIESQLRDIFNDKDIHFRS